MRRALPLMFSVLLVGSLAASSLNLAMAEEEYPACDQRAPTFRTPIRLGTGSGYEPSIETDSKGTVYVMAHKLSLAAEGAGANSRTASWLWRSVDDGKTFTDMSGHSGATNLSWALEGDGAVDKNDRFYYVDTFATDNFFSRYTDRGATLETWRPGVVSLEAVDDRPWVAAHHDGMVYYMSNSAMPTGRLIVHRSTDGGATFDPVGTSFPDSLWGFIDADPNSNYVYAFMSQSSNDDMVVWVSPNRGLAWEKHVVANKDAPESNLGFPNVAVSPVDGTLYAMWDETNSLKLGISKDHGETWTVETVNPFAGRFSHPWVTVGPTGDVGVLFEADPNAVNGNAGYVYGMIWRPSSECLTVPGQLESLCTGPAKTYARLQSAAVPSQEHFITNEILPNNAFVAPFEATGSQIKYSHQATGPNMDGTRFCGTIGTP